MVLAVAVSKKISDVSSSLQIFSDSQSAVGILTLNWASTKFTVLISHIKSLLNQLQFTAFVVSIHLTPEHATIIISSTKLLTGWLKMLHIKVSKKAKKIIYKKARRPALSQQVTEGCKYAFGYLYCHQSGYQVCIKETGRFLYTFKVRKKQRSRN